MQREHEEEVEQFDPVTLDEVVTWLEEYKKGIYPIVQFAREFIKEYGREDLNTFYYVVREHYKVPNTNHMRIDYEESDE